MITNVFANSLACVSGTYIYYAFNFRALTWLLNRQPIRYNDHIYGTLCLYINDIGLVYRQNRIKNHQSNHECWVNLQTQASEHYPHSTHIPLISVQWSIRIYGVRVVDWNSMAALGRKFQFVSERQRLLPRLTCHLEYSEIHTLINNISVGLLNRQCCPPLLRTH